MKLLPLLRQFFTEMRYVRTEGYKILPRGRHEIDCIEGDHLMRVHAERCTGEYKRALFEGTVKAWQPPFEEETVSEEKTKEIIKRIKDAFEKRSVRTMLVKERKNGAESNGG